MNFDNPQQQYESLLTIMNPPQVNVIDSPKNREVSVTFRMPTDDGSQGQQTVFKLFLVGKAATQKITHNQAFCYDITQPIQPYQHLQLQALSYDQLIELAHQAIGKFWWNLVLQKFYFGKDTIEKVINDIGSLQLCAIGYTHNQDKSSQPNGALIHKSSIKDSDETLGKTSDYDDLIKQYLYQTLPKPLQTDDFAYAKDYQIIDTLNLKNEIDLHKAKDVILGNINTTQAMTIDLGIAESLNDLITQQCQADSHDVIKARLNRYFMMSVI